MACTVIANCDLCTGGCPIGGIAEFKRVKADECGSVTVGADG